MIGKPGRKYISCEISEIRARERHAGVDSGFSIQALPTVFFRPYGAEEVLEALFPRAHALG